MRNERDISLRRLEELKDFEIADGDPDIRGWEVRTPDGNKIGKVEELIVDTAERRVRYMEVKVDRKALGIDDDRHILVPIGTARLGQDKHDVLLERLPARGLTGAPAYKRGPITRDYETSLRDYYDATAVPADSDYYRNDLYDDTHVRHEPHETVDTRETAGLPKLGDNEVTIPLAEDQEIVVKRPGTNDEIVIRKSRTDVDTGRDRDA